MKLFDKSNARRSLIIALFVSQKTFSFFSTAVYQTLVPNEPPSGISFISQNHFTHFKSDSNLLNERLQHHLSF
jgi:hypothetical protein